VDLEITPEPSEDERQAILEALCLEAAAEGEPGQWRRPALEPTHLKRWPDLGARRDAAGDAERRRSHDGSIG
jgi:hypothetical protein